MSCPPLEALFLGLEASDPEAERHAAACTRCAAALEAHRQLELSLSRLADPAPPHDFVASVMAKVDAAPVRQSRELLAGGAVLAVTMALAALLLPRETFAVESPGAKLLALLHAFGEALAVTGGGASLPVLIGLSLVLLASAVALQRLVLSPARGA